MQHVFLRQDLVNQRRCGGGSERLVFIVFMPIAPVTDGLHEYPRNAMADGSRSKAYTFHLPADRLGIPIS